MVLICLASAVTASLGGTCNAVVTNYLGGKKATATVTATATKGRKYASAEIYLSGDVNPTYWQDVNQTTKESITASRSSSSGVNGFALCTLYDLNGNFIDGEYTGVRHG